MALSFTAASTQYLSQPSAIITAYPCSFACWINPVSNSLALTPWSVGSTSVISYLSALIQSGGSTIQATISQNGVGTKNTNSLANVTYGSWNHISAVFNSATSYSVWLNGVQASGTGITITVSGTNITVLGGLAHGSVTPIAFFNGAIAYPAMWNAALTPTDVANLYNSGSGSDPNNIETANLRSFSYLQGLPYVDAITATAWTVTGSPVVVADPFTLTLTTTSVFPVSIDTFKRIPNPTTTATNIADATDDTLSTRLQQHSDSAVAVETWLLGNPRVFFATDTGSSNAYVVALTLPPSSYIKGMIISMVPSNGNTGASVINASSIGSVAIVKSTGLALTGGELAAGTMAVMVYNGTAFVLTSTSASISSLSPKIVDLGTVNTNQTVSCTGASSVFVKVSLTLGATCNLSLTHLSQGTPLFIDTETQSPTLFTISATDQNGATYTILAIAAGSNPITPTVLNMVSPGENGTHAAGSVYYSGMSGFSGTLASPTLLLVQA